MNLDSPTKYFECTFDEDLQTLLQQLNIPVFEHRMETWLSEYGRHLNITIFARLRDTQSHECGAAVPLVRCHSSNCRPKTEGNVQGFVSQHTEK